MRAAHPIIAIVSTLLTAACGNAGEVKQARQSAYDTDFAVVYSETLRAVQELYPELDDNPVKGKISTVWHQVQYSNEGGEDPKSLQNTNRTLGSDQTSGNNTGTGGTGLTSQSSSSSSPTKQFFIRFDVTVTGRPALFPGGDRIPWLHGLAANAGAPGSGVASHQLRTGRVVGHGRRKMRRTKLATSAYATSRSGRSPRLDKDWG